MASLFCYMFKMRSVARCLADFVAKDKKKHNNFMAFCAKRIPFNMLCRRTEWKIKSYACVCACVCVWWDRRRQCCQKSNTKIRFVRCANLRLESWVYTFKIQCERIALIAVREYTALQNRLFMLCWQRRELWAEWKERRWNDSKPKSERKNWCEEEKKRQMFSGKEEIHCGFFSCAHNGKKRVL